MLDGVVPSLSEVLVGVVVVLISLIAAIIIIKKKPGKKVTTVLGKSRTNVLFIGLCGSGKTTMLMRMLRGGALTEDIPETMMSMRPNQVKITLPGESGKTAKVVDFPGHRRLREDLLGAVEEAKAIVCVVDSVTINDDKEGGSAVADLLSDVVRAPVFKGVKGVLIACTKRDEITSFSAKAVRKLLEQEIARQVATQAASVGSIGNKNTISSTEFAVDEAGKFSFDFCDVPFTFANVCSKSDDPANAAFDLKPVFEFLEQFA